MSFRQLLSFFLLFIRIALITPPFWGGREVISGLFLLFTYWIQQPGAQSQAEPGLSAEVCESSRPVVCVSLGVCKGVSPSLESYLYFLFLRRGNIPAAPRESPPSHRERRAAEDNGNVKWETWAPHLNRREAQGTSVPEMAWASGAAALLGDVSALARLPQRPLSASLLTGKASGRLQVLCDSAQPPFRTSALDDVGNVKSSI